MAIQLTEQDLKMIIFGIHPTYSYIQSDKNLLKVLSGKSICDFNTGICKPTGKPKVKKTAGTKKPKSGIAKKVKKSADDKPRCQYGNCTSLVCNSCTRSGCECKSWKYCCKHCDNGCN